MENKWTKDEVVKHFQGRAPEYIEMARRVAREPLNFNYPYDGVENILTAWFWLLDFMHPRPASVLDVGCGAGTFCKLLGLGFGLTYNGVDSSEGAIAAAQDIWPNQDRFQAGDIVEGPPFSVGGDLIFIHGVLMHLSPEDAAKVAAWTQKRGRAVMVCEKARMDKWKEDGLAPHVWLHDYEALFGKSSYQARMNRTKDIWIFKGK